MKKILIALVIVPFLAVPSVSFAFSNDLHYGSTGNEVTELQEFLTAQGIYNGPITGNFYSLTLLAVKRFQTLENISPVSGYFGPISRSVANALLTAAIPTSEENAATSTPAIDLSGNQTNSNQQQGTINTPVANQNPAIPAPNDTEATHIAGSITTNTPSMPTDKSKITAVLAWHNTNDASQPFGFYAIIVRVFGTDGKQQGADRFIHPRDPSNVLVPVKMSAPNNLLNAGADQEATIDSIPETGSKDYQHIFGYAPSQKGVATLTFTSGMLSTTLDIDVE